VRGSSPLALVVVCGAGCCAALGAACGVVLGVVCCCVVVCCAGAGCGLGLGFAGCWDWLAKGSVYCSSPAPFCAYAPVGAASAATAVAVATMRCKAGTLFDATVAAGVSTTDPALEDPPTRARPPLREAISRSESGKAAGLAAATLANNAIQLAFTVVFTRLLGATGYGTLAALISAFLILLVAGQSMQAAAAREAAMDRLGHPDVLRATLSAWIRRLLLGFVVVVLLSALLREQLAALIGVHDVPWAAAAIPPTGVLWMLLCLQRGALQGLGRYRPVGESIVGEAGGRLVFGLLLYAVGLGVTGALLGTPLAFAVVALWLERELHHTVGPVRPVDRPVRTLRSVVTDGWAPIIGLVFLASLQNIDVIMAKHQLSGDDAGSYAAAAVAAKAVVWVAIGVGLHLLPEATRRAAAGRSPRPVLMRALGIVAVVAAPALLVFAVAPHLLLRLAFGPDLTGAADALAVLGAAMTVLAVTYLTVQYLLALHRTAFLWALGAVAVAEPILLASAGTSILGFADIVLGLQVAAAIAVLGFAAVAGAGARRHAPAPALPD
jgi:O-antigen/teichoic acid export membrane protein